MELRNLSAALTLIDKTLNTENGKGSVFNKLQDGDYYCSNNFNAAVPVELPYPMWTSLALALSLGFMTVFTAVGNILVCLSVFLVKKLRKASNLLLVSLAVSDLCVALLVMPFALHYELSGSWHLGPTACDLWVACDVTCCTASILNLCMISIDRYFAITKPLTYGIRRRARRTYLSIALIWLMSVLVSVPPFLVLGNEHCDESGRPTCDVSQHFGYQLYATLSSFYVPMVVMVFVYWKIYGAAKRAVECDRKSRQASFANFRSTETHADPLLNDFQQIIVETVSSNRMSRMSTAMRERKASITLGIIMSAFMACWMPFFVVALLRSLFSELWIPHLVRSGVLWLGYANSMLNPIIYVTFHQDFRRSFKEILCFRFRRVNDMFRKEAFENQFGVETTKCTLKSYLQTNSFLKCNVQIKTTIS